MNDTIREERVVLGDIKHGRRPHINFRGVRYSSQDLANSPALIGQRINLVIDPQNILALEAFDGKGRSIGPLVMMGSNHLRKLKTLDERREFLRESKSHRMAFSRKEPAIDEIVAYIKEHNDMGSRKKDVRKRTLAGGAMQALLENHPKIARQVKSMAIQRPGKSLRQIHFAMLEALRDKGLQDVDYPFASHDLSLNALRHHLDALNRKGSR